MTGFLFLVLAGNGVFRPIRRVIRQKKHRHESLPVLLNWFTKCKPPKYDGYLLFFLSFPQVRASFLTCREAGGAEAGGGKKMATCLFTQMFCGQPPLIIVVCALSVSGFELAGP